MGLHFSVHVTGPDHCSGIHDDLISGDLSAWESIDFAESMPSTELSPRKARMVYHAGLWRQMGNYLGLCNFVPWTYQQITEATEHITGLPMSYWKLMKAVERGITLGRIFNLREGFSSREDQLPRRFSASPPEGPLKGIVIDPEKLREAQKAYYQMLGWDESGVPTHGRMVELSIEWASDHLRNPRG
jgi:aldehyde:ferredoxin oxidoreductase